MKAPKNRHTDRKKKHNNRMIDRKPQKQMDKDRKEFDRTERKISERKGEREREQGRERERERERERRKRYRVYQQSQANFISNASV